MLIVVIVVNKLSRRRVLANFSVQSLGRSFRGKCAFLEIPEFPLRRRVGGSIHVKNQLNSSSLSDTILTSEMDRHTGKAYAALAHRVTWQKKTARAIHLFRELYTKTRPSRPIKIFRHLCFKNKFFLFSWQTATKRTLYTQKKRCAE